MAAPYDVKRAKLRTDETGENAMRINNVRLRRVTGTMPVDGAFWEERLVRPIDVYDEYRHRQDYEGGTQTAKGFELATVFLEIDTDQGVSGRAGPLPDG